MAACVCTNASWAQTYNPAKEYENGWKSGDNPNGVWSYGYSLGFTSRITRYNGTLEENPPQLHDWYSTAVYDDFSPVAKFNDGPAINDGNNDFLAHEFILVAGVDGQHYSNLIFTAPATTSYSINCVFRGAQYNVGDVVGVISNKKVLFQSSITAVNETKKYKAQLALNQGETVIFSVGPDGGLQNVGVALTIQQSN
jgi:hypothetical protein